MFETSSQASVESNSLLLDLHKLMKRNRMLLRHDGERDQNEMNRSEWLAIRASSTYTLKVKITWNPTSFAGKYR